MTPHTFTNHDAPELCVERLLRTAAIQRTTRRRRWPGLVLAFACGSLWPALLYVALAP